MEEIIKETKYLIFKVKKSNRKTKIISVINKSGGYELATIEWYGAWRQYIFQPDYGMVWNITCLQDVMDVISQLMNERRIAQINKPTKVITKNRQEYESRRFTSW